MVPAPFCFDGDRVNDTHAARQQRARHLVIVAVVAILSCDGMGFGEPRWHRHRASVDVAAGQRGREAVSKAERRDSNPRPPA